LIKNILTLNGGFTLPPACNFVDLFYYEELNSRRLHFANTNLPLRTPAIKKVK